MRVKNRPNLRFGEWRIVTLAPLHSAPLFQAAGLIMLIGMFAVILCVRAAAIGVPRNRQTVRSRLKTLRRGDDEPRAVHLNADDL